VRNPWSAYADTKKRPVPLSIDGYMLGWSLTQRYALMLRERYPGRMHVLRIEDILEDPVNVLGGLCEAIGLDHSAALARPSWNGEALDEVYPWGTIRNATPEGNRRTAQELTREEWTRVRERAGLFIDAFDYSGFLTR